MRALLLAAFCAAASTLAGCGGECEVGQTRPCYSGAPGTAGKGLCKAGVQACIDGKWDTACPDEVKPATESCDTVDNDCDGETDDGVLNACGGCSLLQGEPGTLCAGCGKWECDAQEAVRCVPPEHAVNTRCESEAGCPGTYRCSQEGEVVCAAPRKNACGVCGGTEVTGVGEACTGTNGCDGALACNGGGTGTVCEAPRRNNCGICGGTDVENLDGTCTKDGCSGILKCDEAGTGSVCVAPVKNECGKCGGDAITGLGDACQGADGCAGTLVCNTAGTGTKCNAPVKNACGVCGGPSVTGIGTACTLNGCSGTWKCKAEGDGRVCDAPVKNECGLCGGPALAEMGNACGGTGECAGTLTCNAAKDALVCTNTNLGQACTAANGCAGTKQCAASGDTLECQAPAKNECGVCGGPALADKGTACGGTGPCSGTWECRTAGTALECRFPSLGDACVGANGCDGAKQCNAAGDAIECAAPAKNSCDLCGGPTIAETLGAECTNGAGCAGTWTCVDDKRSAYCKPIQSCGTIATHVVISEVAGTGPGGSQDEIYELYNPTGAEVDIAGWVIWYGTASESQSTISKILTLPAGAKIGANKYYLAANHQYVTGANSPAPDVKLLSTDNINIANSSGGQIWLTSNSTRPTAVDAANVVDMVGYGSAIRYEGWVSGGGGTASPAPAPGSASIERKAYAASTASSMASGGADATKGNGQDTNKSNSDWVLRTSRNPQSSASPAEIP